MVYSDKRKQKTNKKPNPSLIFVILAVSEFSKVFLIKENFIAGYGVVYLLFQRGRQLNELKARLFYIASSGSATPT